MINPSKRLRSIFNIRRTRQERVKLVCYAAKARKVFAVYNITIKQKKQSLI